MQEIGLPVATVQQSPEGGSVLQLLITDIGTAPTSMGTLSQDANDLLSQAQNAVKQSQQSNDPNINPTVNIVNPISCVTSVPHNSDTCNILDQAMLEVNGTQCHSAEVGAGDGMVTLQNMTAQNTSFVMQDLSRPGVLTSPVLSQTSNPAVDGSGEQTILVQNVTAVGGEPGQVVLHLSEQSVASINELNATSVMTSSSSGTETNQTQDDNRQIINSYHLEDMNNVPLSAIMGCDSGVMVSNNEEGNVKNILNANHGSQPIITGSFSLSDSSNLHDENNFKS